MIKEYLKIVDEYITNEEYNSYIHNYAKEIAQDDFVLTGYENGFTIEDILMKKNLKVQATSTDHLELQMTYRYNDENNVFKFHDVKIDFCKLGTFVEEIISDGFKYNYKKEAYYDNKMKYFLECSFNADNLKKLNSSKEVFFMENNIGFTSEIDKNKKSKYSKIKVNKPYIFNTKEEQIECSLEFLENINNIKYQTKKREYKKQIKKSILK